MLRSGRLVGLGLALIASRGCSARVHGNASATAASPPAGASVDALAARARALLAAPPSQDTAALGAILLRLARERPAVAGALGCEALRREIASAAPAAHTASLLAIAHAGVRCDAVLALVSAARCDAAFYCGASAARHVCTRDELAPALTAALARAPSAPPAPGERDAALLAALLIHDGAREVLARWDARHGYTVEQPAGPACAARVAPGTPCHCAEGVPPGACGGELDALCAFRVDDSARRITAVVRR